MWWGSYNTIRRTTILIQSLRGRVCIIWHSSPMKCPQWSIRWTRIHGIWVLVVLAAILTPPWVGQEVIGGWVTGGKECLHRGIVGSLVVKVPVFFCGMNVTYKTYRNESLRNISEILLFKCQNKNFANFQTLTELDYTLLSAAAKFKHIHVFQF